MAENVKLGVGDPRKFNLLGGSFGEAGDIVLAGNGAGVRFFPSAKAKILQASSYSSMTPRDLSDHGMGRPGGRR